MGITHPLFFVIQPKFTNITGIVLGGGQSRRMGRDKRFLLWEGEGFLDRICRIMCGIFDEVLVVAAQNDYENLKFPVRIITDKIPYKGSLGGLYTGLLEAKNTLSFVVGCDMPFLQKECITRMCERAYNDVLVVKLSTGIQPLHARYSKHCVSRIENLLGKDQLKIQNLTTQSGLSLEILPESFFHEIDPFGKSFLNINTPADLEFARKLSSGSPHIH